MKNLYVLSSVKKSLIAKVGFGDRCARLASKTFYVVSSSLFFERGINTEKRNHRDKGKTVKNKLQLLRWCEQFDRLNKVTGYFVLKKDTFWEASSVRRSISDCMNKNYEFL